jgi:hypothetical protein
MVVRKNDRDREQIPDEWDVKQEQSRNTAFSLNKTGREEHNAHFGAGRGDQRGGDSKERERSTGCNTFYNTLNPGVGSD